MKNKQRLILRNKLLVIVGVTGMGKTKLALYLAQKFNGEIISADSRQVYKYMDIGTGKEWGSIHIHGYGLVDPRENYSVYDFFKFGKATIENIWSRNKLPILAGGTGLYIKSIVDGIQTIDIPKNDNLRIELEKLSTKELFEKLAILDSSKAASMNLSDKNNPRRLIRAIEIATWNIENGVSYKEIEKRKEVLNKNVSVLIIGLTAPIERINQRIEKRIEERLNNGFIDEIENLLKMGVSWKNQSLKSIGYKEAEEFLKKGLGFEEFIEKWIKSETDYAKRQITWFKKNKKILWFDIYNRNYPKDVESVVNKWYYSNINTDDEKG